MNILVINWQDIKNPFAGGAEVHMHEIFKRIVAKGHQVTIFCSMFEGASEEDEYDGIKIIRKGSRNLFNFVVRKHYKNVLSKMNFDIVIDDINKIPFYTPRFIKEPLLAISHHFFGKSIFKEAGIIAGTYVYLAEKLVDNYYKQTEFAVVSQSTLDEFIERGFDQEKFTIVPNAIQTEQFPFNVTEENYGMNISYFGRLKKYKSVDHIVKAFAEVKKNIPELKLNIIGAGDFRPELEKLAKELNVSGSIKFWGFVDEDTKVKLLKETFAVINPSIKEGWGITNIEANACGTPVISANSPGLRDSVLPGKSGELYEYGNIEELIDKINKIVLDENLRKKLSEGAVDWAKQFSWDESAEIMLKLIEKVNKKKSA